MGGLPGKANRALVASLNRTITGARTDAARAVSKVFVVTQRDVRETLDIRKATKNSLEASLRSEGAAIRLYKYGLKPKAIKHPGPAGGLRIRIKRAGGRESWPHAFVARMPSGHVGVFTSRKRQDRVGQMKRRSRWAGKTLSRYEMKERFGPAIPSMLQDTGAFSEIQRGAEERLAKNIDQQITRLVKGYGT